VLVLDNCLKISDFHSSLKPPDDSSGQEYPVLHIHLILGHRTDFVISLLAIAFRSLFYHLMHNPDVYARLEKEVDEAVKESRISLPPTYKQASQLPYLCACIKEALRIHPGAQLCK
jgi:hypothetical protein